MQLALTAFNMAEGENKYTSLSFMREIQKYPCIYNKFSKDYKNKQQRESCWEALATKFEMTPEEADRRYRSIRSSFGRYLRKNKVPFGSSADTVPTPKGIFANLKWLEEHMSHRKSSSNSVGKEEELENSDTCDYGDYVPENHVSRVSMCFEDNGNQSNQDTSTSNDEKDNKKPYIGASPKRPRAPSMNIVNKSSDNAMDMMAITKHVDDEDSLYALSLAKRMRRLPPRSRGLLRLHIEQLFFQAEFGSSSQSQRDGMTDFDCFPNNDNEFAHQPPQNTQETRHTEALGCQHQSVTNELVEQFPTSRVDTSPDDKKETIPIVDSLRL